MRERSGAEVAFGVMRALATARLLWAGGGAVPIDALPALLRAPAEAIAVAIDQLCEQGIADVSANGRTVGFTERAALELLRQELRPPGAPPARHGPPTGGASRSA